jgi:hypothetical protein
MADIGAFPTIRNVLYSGKNIVYLTATTAISAGMVVAPAALGASGAVIPHIKATTVQPIGVAIYDIGAGAVGAIALEGCVVYVANAESDVDIDAGDILEGNDNAVGGTVSAGALVDAGAVGVIKNQIGIALDDILRSTTGRMLIVCGNYASANNA